MFVPVAAGVPGDGEVHAAVAKTPAQIQMAVPVLFTRDRMQDERERTMNR
jgi:hypothetical protein